jgi:hypothetical protein
MQWDFFVLPAAGRLIELQWRRSVQQLYFNWLDIHAKKQSD